MTCSSDEQRHQEIQSALICYLDTYFIQRDLEKTLELFSPHIAGFGSGIDEKSQSFIEFKELYARDINQAPEKVDYELMDCCINSLVPNSGIVSCELNIKTIIKGQELKLNHFRLSIFFNKVKTRWLIEHMHLSLPTEVHSEGEAYPIKELEDRNKILQQLVDKKTKTLNDSNQKLITALNEIKTLRGILPICARCKKIRDDKGYWNNLESYIQKHSEASFSHGMCHECSDELYGDEDWYIKMKKKNAKK